MNKMEGNSKHPIFAINRIMGLLIGLCFMGAVLYTSWYGAIFLGLIHIYKTENAPKVLEYAEQWTASQKAHFFLNAYIGGNKLDSWIESCREESCLPEALLSSSDLSKYGDLLELESYYKLCANAAIDTTSKQWSNSDIFNKRISESLPSRSKVPPSRYVEACNRYIVKKTNSDPEIIFDCLLLNARLSEKVNEFQLYEDEFIFNVFFDTHYCFGDDARNILGSEDR